MDNYVAPPTKPNEVLVSYMEGPKVEILGDTFEEYW
jgi:hypothetical protein